MYIPQKLIIENLLTHKDTKFEFRKGKAVLVLGENLDKEGSRTNGAGKSSLNECFSIAYTGESIRKVSEKELVRNGEQSGSVELILYNTQSREYFKIRRTLFTSKSKSSKCQVWISNCGNEWVEDRTSADINTYNRFIVEKVGISKDDFFSFFLITKEKYKSFLSQIGDTEKKEIINRFSGANVLDNVKVYIDEDVEKKDKQINDVEKEITIQEAKASVFAEQIAQEEELLSDERIQKRVEEIEKDITELELMNQVLNEEFGKGELEIINIKNNKEIEIVELEKIKNEKELITEKWKDIQFTINTQNKNLTDIDDKYKGEINELIDREHEIKNTIDIYEKAIKENREILIEIKNDLVLKNKQLENEYNLSKNKLEAEVKNIKLILDEQQIECPHCQGKFLLDNEGKTIEDYNNRLTEIEKEIEIQEIKKLEGIEHNTFTHQNIHNENSKEIEDWNKEIIEQESILEEVQKEKDNIYKKIELEKVSIIEKITNLKIEADNHNKKIAELNQQDFQLTKSLNELDRQILAIESSNGNHIQKAEMNDLRKTQYLEKIELVKQKDETEINKLREQIKVTQKIANDKEEEKAVLIKEKSDIETWITHFKNFKSSVANKSIRNIQDYTNFFLNSIGTNITIELDGYKTLANKKIKEEITTKVLKNGLEIGSIGKFSAGERGRVDMCCILAIRELVNLNCKTGGLDLLVCDEILDSVDTYGLGLITESLQTLGQTIMIVSQNEVTSQNENLVKITKENGISSISC